MYEEFFDKTLFFCYNSGEFIGEVVEVRKILITILIGFSMILIGSGLEIEEIQAQQTIIIKNNTDSKKFQTASINLSQIKKSTEQKKDNVKMIKQVIEVPDIEQDDEIEETVPIRYFYNPTNNGYISGGMGNRSDGFHYGYDITSPLGKNEIIYPIAEGVITGIFNDGAGANIVTIGHNIGGKAYSSMYVHLSDYAKGIYVGEAVTTNTPLGNMGMTGNATGVHLHLEVADCLLFNKEDNNCSSISKYYNYLKRRYNEGFTGAGTVLNLPKSWNSR